MKIKSVHIQEKYSAETRSPYYDIAIVEVDRIPFSTKYGNIWPVCIPEKTNPDRNHLSRQGITVIGYGPAPREKDEPGNFYLT